MKNQSLLFIFAAFSISYTYAAPDDLFLQATPAKNKLTTNASLDIVNDTVDFLDLRESEGVKGDSGDYLGGHISSQYQLHPEWAINADYWRREIEFGKDTNKLNSGALGLLTFQQVYLQIALILLLNCLFGATRRMKSQKPLQLI